MAWVEPKLWKAGETVTAAMMNREVRDRFGDLWTVTQKGDIQAAKSSIALANVQAIDTYALTADSAKAAGMAFENRMVTNGDSHDHNGGDGGTINHSSLGSAGSSSGHVTNGNSHTHASGAGAQIPAGAIASNAITTAKIADYTVSLSKLAAAVPVIPVGGIVMYYGSSASVPANWAVCNGGSGTPDLRDRFVVSVGSSYARGATGGSATISHTHSNSGKSTNNSDTHAHWVYFTDNRTAIDGEHSHGGITSEASGGHIHTLTVTDKAYDRLFGSGTGTSILANIGHTHAPLTITQDAHTHSVATASDGAHSHYLMGFASDYDGAHSHSLPDFASYAQSALPPYYGLFFIQRIS